MHDFHRLPIAEVNVIENQVKELEALVQAEEGRLAELKLRDPAVEVEA